MTLNNRGENYDTRSKRRTDNKRNPDNKRVSGANRDPLQKSFDTSDRY